LDAIFTDLDEQSPARQPVLQVMGGS